MPGFKIELKNISEKIKSLHFKLRNANTDVVSELPTAINFFNEFLYEYSESKNSCLKHFHKLYKTLPKDVNYYFNVETYSYRDGGTFQRFCYPIGTGKDEVDALSSHLLIPSISSTRPNSVTSIKDGHFVKATVVNNEMIFENIVGDYNLKVKNSYTLKREKLKKITLNLSIDESPIPEDLKYSKYWNQILENYENRIQNNSILKDLKEQNEKLCKVEKEFYDSVKLYQDYKKQLQSVQITNQLIAVIQGGLSYMSDNYSKDELSDKFEKINSRIDSLKNEVNKVKDFTLNLKQETTTVINNITQIHIQNNIPMNDVPDINTRWKPLLD